MTLGDFILQASIILFPILCGVLGWHFRAISKNSVDISALDARVDALEQRIQIVESHFASITQQLSMLTIVCTRLEERLKIMMDGEDKK